MRDKILKHQHQLETCQKELKFQGFLFSGCIFGTLILLLHTKYGWYDILFDPCRALVFNNSLKPHWVEYPISILAGIVGLATHSIESSRPDQVGMLCCYWLAQWKCTNVFTIDNYLHNVAAGEYNMYTIPLSTHHNAAQWHGRWRWQPDSILFTHYSQEALLNASQIGILTS